MWLKTESLLTLPMLLSGAWMILAGLFLTILAITRKPLPGARQTGGPPTGGGECVENRHHWIDYLPAPPSIPNGDPNSYNDVPRFVLGPPLPIRLDTPQLKSKLMELELTEDIATPIPFLVVHDQYDHQFCDRVNRLFTLAPADLAGSLRAVFITKGNQYLLGPLVDQVFRRPLPGTPGMARTGICQEPDPNFIRVKFQPWTMPIRAKIVGCMVIQGDYHDRQWYFVHEQAVADPILITYEGNQVVFEALIERPMTNHPSLALSEEGVPSKRTGCA